MLNRNRIEVVPPPDRCDLLVIGSGAAGLTAAITAANTGLKVVLVEKSRFVGGATALSGGWVWLPDTPEAIKVNGSQDGQLALTYLTDIMGQTADIPRLKAFIQGSGRLEAFLREHTPVRFQPNVSLPDYEMDRTGAAPGGRSRVVAPYDARGLGRAILRLRRPLPQLTLAGLMPSAGPEMRHFLQSGRRLGSFLYVLGRLVRHALEWLAVGRARTLTNGNALAGALFKAALDKGVHILTETEARDLFFEEERVVGVTLRQGNGEHRITTSRGVILASGGFPGSAALRAQYYPHARAGASHWTLVPTECDGRGLHLAQQAGARILKQDTGTSYRGNGAWVPVSLAPQPNGSLRPFPHFADRAKPGLIAVLPNGSRFTNEADPYFSFMSALFQATKEGAEPTAWLICDHRFQRRYGLGFSKPFPAPLRPYTSTGYLRRAGSIWRLAEACGIEPGALQETVGSYNLFAARGQDPAFGRGSTPINRAQGDPAVTPNPCIAPIETPPFYAVKIHPGCLGSFAGLKTDPQGRVLNEGDEAIPGLFACGADASNLMAGHYPAGGISLGPALVFGHIAGLAISEEEPATSSHEQKVMHDASL